MGKSIGFVREGAVYALQLFLNLIDGNTVEQKLKNLRARQRAGWARDAEVRRSQNTFPPHEVPEEAKGYNPFGTALSAALKEGFATFKGEKELFRGEVNGLPVRIHVLGTGNATREAWCSECGGSTCPFCKYRGSMTVQGWTIMVQIEGELGFGVSSATDLQWIFDRK